MIVDFSSPQITDALKRNDLTMGRLINRFGPCRIEITPGGVPYDALASAIIFQQLHGRAAGTILQRVKDLVGGERFPLPEELLALPETTLRAAGVSANKQKALRDLAAKALDGTLPTKKAIGRMSDEEIIDKCTCIRGVGRWTVQIMLIFRLGRPDILPIDDFGLRSGLRRAYSLETLPTPKELGDFGLRWSPWRSIASWYLWRVTDAAD